MADCIVFDTGAAYMGTAGLPSTCYFALSRKSVAGGGTVLTTSDTIASITEATGSGYARVSQARPTMSGHTDTWTQFQWATGTATNWPSDVRSLVLCTASSSGVAIAAANLVAGGAAQAMNASGVTLKATPTLTFAGA
jgi:hypothetical protein